MAPWRKAPYSLVSWWDMERFSADEFFEITHLLGKFDQAPVLNDNPVSAASALVTGWIPDLKKRCEVIGLRQTAKHVSRIHSELLKRKTKLSEFQKMIPEIRFRIKDEMEDKLFMYIPSPRAERYDLIEPFGTGVAGNFPSCSYDAKEAGSCFAGARFTACVFHLMRVLEIGLLAFARLFPAVPTDKENWQQIIEKIESEIRDMPKSATKASDWK